MPMNKINILSYFTFSLLLLFTYQVWGNNEYMLTDNMTFSEKPAHTKTLKSLWKKKRAQYYQAYSDKELLLAESVFEQLFDNQLTDKMRDQLVSLNLSLVQLNELLIIREDKPPYTGQGMYVIRPGSSDTLLLQAPHSFHDIKTGSIAIKMMRENTIKALAINTVSRRYSSDGGELKADMAHLPESLFMSFSRAFANVNEQGRIVQLHGFNADKREQTRQLGLILSNGTRAAGQALISQSECLGKALSTKSKLFPQHINLLGGTTNSIGRAVRGMGFSGFEHIEMSLPVRQALNHSAQLRHAFMACVNK